LRRPPGRIAISDAPAGAVEIQDKVVHPAGSVQCLDDERKLFSFALYQLESRVLKEDRTIHPAKAKIPEPQRNLQQRKRWFQNGRKIR
jgi:hypothetical protein